MGVLSKIVSHSPPIRGSNVHGPWRGRDLEGFTPHWVKHLTGSASTDRARAQLKMVKHYRGRVRL